MNVGGGEANGSGGLSMGGLKFGGGGGKKGKKSAATEDPRTREQVRTSSRPDHFCRARLIASASEAHEDPRNTKRHETRVTKRVLVREATKLPFSELGVGRNGSCGTM